MIKPTFALFSIFLFLAACTVTPSSADIHILPTQTSAPASQSTEVIQPLLATPVPTEVLLTGTPATSEATSTQSPRLEAGAPITLASIHMIDPNIGWAIERSGHILRTRDGGSVWQDVTPPQGLYNDNGFFALDADTAWATQKPSEACEDSRITWSDYQACMPGPNVVIWRTTDGGQAWQAGGAYEAEDGHYKPIAVQFIDASTGWFLYVSSFGPMGATTMGMAKTEDGGVSWTRADAPQSMCIHRVMVFTSARAGWSGADCRFTPTVGWPLQDFINGKSASGLGPVAPVLLRTTDSSRSWDDTTLPSPQVFPDELSSPNADPNISILCGTTNMEQISSEAFTLQWTCSPQEGTPPFTDFNYQYFTSDGGQSWHSWLSTGNEIFLTPQIGWRLYSRGEGRVSQLQQTTNSGETWTAIKTVAWESARFDFVSEMEGWAIVTGRGVTTLVHTSDGGKTWDELKPRMASPLTGFIDVHMASENIGWALTQKSDNTNALFYTTDGGLTWTDVTPANLVNSPIHGIFLDAQTAWAESCDYETSKCKLLRTINGGKTWTMQTEDFGFDFFYSSITFLNASDGLVRVYDVGAGHGTTIVYQTHDGGATWKQLILTNPDGMPGRVPGGIDTCNICGDVFYYSPSRLIIIRGDLASDPGGAVYLSISTDLGKTWRDLRLPLPDSKFADGFVAPMQPIFFNDRDGVLPFQIMDQTFTNKVTAIYNTHDGGQTWQTNSNVFENISSIAFLSSQDAFAVCGNTLCVTHDGARTWQTLSTNLNFGYSDSDEYVTQFYFITPSLGWALTVYNDSHTLWKTSDGGKTWEEIKPVIVP